MTKIIIAAFLFLNIHAKDFTLEDAIKASTKGSFTQANMKADIKNEKLNQKYNSSSYIPSLNLKLQAGKELNADDVVDDHFAYLELKNVFYSKETSILKNEYKNNIKVKEMGLSNSIQQRKVKVMRLYFDSLLASYDKQYTLEVLAMKAIRNIKANDYLSTGEISDIKLLETKANMLFASAKKAQVDALFENTRLKLSYFLNLPIENVYNLKNPDLKSYWAKKLPKEEELYKLAFKNDLKLKEMNKSLKSINQKVSSYKNDIDFKVGSTLRYGIEPQKMDMTNDTRWEARVNMSVPLYDAGVNDKTVSSLLISKNKIQNSISKYKLQLKQNVYDLMLEVKKYKKLNTAHEAQLDYRNLYLERARVSYELDRQSDLGDSMAKLTLAEFEYAKNEYNYVISYEMLQLLVGEK